jgi:hypothetical protein
MSSLYQRRFLTTLERFEAQVERVPFSGCWLWLGAIDVAPRLPYGKFWDKRVGRSVVAHRASWMMFRGDIPAGKKVLHRCDVAACVNPEHLFLGSPRENTQDMIRKGRNAPMVATRRGTNSNFNKLTPEQVRSIRSSEGKQREIAASFGVSQSCVSLIKRRVNWSHL